MNARQKRLFEDALRKNPNLKMPTAGPSRRGSLPTRTWLCLKQGVGDKSGRPQMTPAASRRGRRRRSGGSPDRLCHDLLRGKGFRLPAPGRRRKGHLLPHLPAASGTGHGSRAGHAVSLTTSAWTGTARSPPAACGFCHPPKKPKPNAEVKACTAEESLERTAQPCPTRF